MAYKAYAYYNIWLSDVAEYQFAVSVAGGNLINISPIGAATLFGIPIPFPSGDMSTIDKTITFIPGWADGDEINNPYPSGIFLDENVDSKTVPGQAGVPASVWPAGPDLEMIWTGLILGLNTQGPPPDVPNVMSQRRWIQGYEMMPHMEGSGSGNVGLMSRVGARTNGEHGYVVRGQNTNGPVRHTVDDFRTGLITPTSWERFYVRLRSPGSASCGLWRCFGFPSSDAGAGLRILTDGSIGVYMINAVNTVTLVGNLGILDLNIYNRIDIFIRYKQSPSAGVISIYVNGIPILSYTDAVGDGLGGASRHISTDIGKWSSDSGADNLIEYDIDDWMNADLPFDVDSITLTFTDSNFPLDWVAGSHMRPVYSLSATQAGWAPINAAVLNQAISPKVLANISQLLSTTSGAQIDGLTDHNNDQDQIAQKLGVIAAVIGDDSADAGADGQSGYRLAGGAPVLIPISQNGILTTHSVMYNPAGLTEPLDIVPFHVMREKGLDISQDVTTALQAVIEYLGAWGPEDGQDTQVNTMDFLHNCRYTNSLWGYLGGYTDGPVFAIGGTYVGNGTFQNINLPLPCHFLIIRPPSGVSSAGIRFFGSSVGANKGDSDQISANVRVWMDDTQQVKVTVSGIDPECNEVGRIYQYIAFCDPGMRYNICGAYNHPTAGISPRTNDIGYINPLWTPEFAWVQNGIPGVPSSTGGLALKGPNLTTNGVTSRGVNIPQFGSFSAGSFESRSGIHYDTPSQVNYSLWRKADDICGDIMLQIFSYTGDGTAPDRVIAFPDVTMRYPLFAHVQPANDVGIFRDPSHVGTNSASAVTMNNIGAGIVAGGVDSITVGNALNAIGINYDVFIILGSDIGWLNGVYSPPDCEGAFVPPPLPPLPEIAVMAEGGLILGGSTATTLLRDVSGIYTLVPGKPNDTLYNRQTEAPSADVKIPDPMFKTGYIGG